MCSRLTASARRGNGVLGNSTVDSYGLFGCFLTESLALRTVDWCMVRLKSNVCVLVRKGVRVGANNQLILKGIGMATRNGHKVSALCVHCD
jgi:hypothetical protein